MAYDVKTYLQTKMNHNLSLLKFAGIWKVWMLSLQRCCLLQRWSSLLPTWNPMWYYAWSLCSRSGGHFISQFFPWKGKQQFLWIDAKTNQRRWLCWARGIFPTVNIFCSCRKKLISRKIMTYFVKSTLLHSSWDFSRQIVPLSFSLCWNKGWFCKRPWWR